MTELAIVLIAVVLVAAIAYTLFRASRARSVPSSEAAPREAAGDELQVTLPVDDADPDSDATKRLVSEAGRHALAAHPEVIGVVVASRGGRVLGRVGRVVAPPAGPLPEVPLALREPHARRHAGPGEPSSSEPVVHTGNVRFDDARAAPHLTLAERFELDGAVRARIGNPEDPVDIVRAIIETSGATVDVDGSLFRRGDDAVIVLHTPLHVSVDPEAMNAAFLRFQRSGARRGVVVTAGSLHVVEARRRQALAPQLLYAGVDAIQRMADAAAMGADPFDFVFLAA